MDSEELASMYAQVVRGVAKEDSRFVTDHESSAEWDAITAEVAAIRERNPYATFAIPNEIPGPPGTVPGDPSPAADADEAADPSGRPMDQPTETS